MKLINRIILLPGNDQYIVAEATPACDKGGIVADMSAFNPQVIKSQKQQQSQKSDYLALRLEAFNQLKDRLN